MRSTTIIKTLILLLASLLWYGGHAQNTDKIDSMKLHLQDDLHDTLRIDILNNISADYSPLDFDSAKYFANKAFQLSTQIGDETRIAWAYHRRGRAYDYHGDPDSAFLWYNTSLDIFKELQDTIGLTSAYLNIGVCFQFGTNYDSAVIYYLKVVALNERPNPDKNLPYALNNLAIIFRRQEEYTKAIKYYEKSLELKKRTKDNEGIFTTLENMSVSYEFMGDIKKSKEIMQQAHELALKMSDEYLIGYSNLRLGQLYHKLEKFQDALNSFLFAKKTIPLGRRREHLTIRISLASVFHQLSNYDLAEQYFIEAEQLGMEIESAKQLLDIYSGLSLLYENKGRFDVSLRYYKKYDSLSSLMYNESKTAIISDLEKKYQTEVKEKEIASLEIEQQKVALSLEVSQNQRNIFIFSSAIILFLAGLIGYRFYDKQKINKILETKNGIIQASLDEKEILLKEIHHRVKNNLQIVSSLLKLQSRYIKDDQAIEAVKEGQNRVKSMALIHQRLYQKDNLTGIEMPGYIENLTAGLFQSYGVNQDHVGFDIDVPPLRLDVDTAIPLGLILNELVSNSLKHAFVEEKKGLVEVKLKELDQLLILKVADNGKGIDPNNEQKDESFGMSLIASLAQKLKATTDIDSSQGTSYTLEINNYKIV